MKLACRVALSASVCALIATSCFAAPQAAAQQPPAQQQDAQKPPAQKPDDKQKPDEKPQRYEETVVVSASKTEEKLVNAPATMTVVGLQQIETATSQNFAELLRTVPGLNMTQVSARDINITTRGATGTLATGQLALLDGRSLYQDFFGFVMWDFLPVNLNEIKQIEVIHGPASAVWGANALYGVVNVITKSPREMQGTSAILGFGAFEKTGGENSGSLWYVSGTHAQAINDKWAFKLSAGGYTQDPLSRPTGIIPGSPGSATGGGTPYPPYTNTGTAQPKFDGRLDYDYENGAKLAISGGVAGTEGIMHSGIGPFDINSGSVMSYVKANYTKAGLRAGFFTNILNGDASNLLTRDTAGKPIAFAFNTKTYDFDISNVQTFAKRHVVNYGGNLRYNKFDLSLAPTADNRTEFGLYGQDEIFLNDHFRWVIGGRVDRFDYLNALVFSPRTTFLIKPQENQTVRLSYNRAYRSPSVINNHLDVTTAERLTLAPGLVYPLPIHSVGNPDLKETSLDAYEIGYTGIVGRTVLSAAFYVNKSTNDILFTEEKSGRWTATNPPPGWPLPPIVISIATGGAGFPGLFTYKNFGHTTQKGLELGVDSSVNKFVNVFTNYSYQATPVPEDFDISELNLPPKNRFNTGFSFTYNRYLGNLSVSYTDDAFWQDVLDDRYHGTTKAYTLVNGGFGVKWAGEKLTTSIKAVNIGNADVQQHVFGDILKRQIVGELRVQF
jgi:iron complex outermembrane receptor protein